ncbi:Single-stranded DNA-binding protein [Oligella sp. MSHR50489EDL]|uniref:single-stranded DNA-binding protein n=1 Tax=Oligella sp. MSHR50489EDL TaxID=3139409 RepID=UPI003D8154D6
MNRITLIGRIGQDITTDTTNNGLHIAKFTLATNYWSQGYKHTEWHNIVCFDKNAEIAGKYLVKGDQVTIVGELGSTKFKDKNGIDRRRYEIRCREIHLLNNPRQNEEQQKTEVTEDIPF